MTKNRDISKILDQNTTFTATVSVGSGTANVFANSTLIKVANSTVNTYLRVPSTTEYAGNYYLHANGTWQLVSAGATPGGSNTYVQFNDSTALGGTAGFTFDKATNNVVIANTLTVGTATINSTNYSQTANNATWHGTSVFANSTGAYPTSNSVGAVLGNTISRVVITGNSATFSSTLAATDTTITGFVNATVSVNSAAHTIGTTFVANTLGLYHTGTVNAASFTTTGFLANTTAVVPTSNSSGQTFGNTISRWVMTANSLTVSGGVSPDSNTLGTALGSTTQRWVGLANTITVSGGVSPDSNTLGTALGTTTQRWVITGNSATFTSTLAAGDTTITGFVNATVVVNSAAHTVGTTFIANTLGVYHTGTINAASHTTTGFLANATHVVPTSNSSGQTFGNTISRWVITANSVTTSGGVSPDSNTLGTALGTTTQRWVLTANSADIGPNFVANSLGAYHTAVINAASHTTTGFTANATHVVPTSNSSGQTFGNTIARWVMTANSLTVSGGASPDSNTLGTALGTTTQRWVLLANTIESTGLANVSALNVVNQTNTATLFVTTSANVGANVLANTTTIIVGNSTTNVIIGNNVVDIGNTTVNTYANSTLVKVANATSNSIITPASYFTGNSVANLNANSTVIKLANSTSNTTLTIPSAADWAGSKFLHANGSWAAPVAAAAAGGSNTHVQFNDSTAIGGSAGFTFDKTTNNVFFANTLQSGNSTVNAVANSTTLLFSNSTTETISANSAALAIGNSTVNNTLNSVCIAINVSPTANLTSNTVIVQLANNSGTSNLTPTSLAIATSLLANSTGLYPGSNTVGDEFGNTIARWTAYLAGQTANSLGIYPISNTAGDNLGNTTARYDVYMSGQTANSLGIYPISNTSGQLFGNTIARWDLFTTGQTTNSLGIYPVSNTVGQLFGNTISRFSITANAVNIGPGTTTVAPLVFTSGTNLSTAAAGAEEFDGVQYYKTIDTSSGRAAIPAEQYFHLTADGSTISTIANFFGTTSNPALVSGAHYIIDIYCFYLCSTAGTVTWTFTNSVAPTSQSILARLSPATGVQAAPGTATERWGHIHHDATAARTYVDNATLTTAVNHFAHFKIFLVNSTGTNLKIQATKLVGGTITPLRNSWWFCRRMSPSNIGTFAA